MLGRMGIAAIVITVLAAALPLRARAAEGASSPLFSLAALISVDPDLPLLSRSVLVTEAERIWRREGVGLTWTVVPKSGPPAAPLRVLVINRRETVKTNGSVWPVGELIPHSGQRALAIASIAGAERVVAASGRRVELLDGPDGAHYRLGLVLGRAVAHEIGHYLLSTGTHADRGLMRAEISAREFSDPAARTFTLDDAAGLWLRTRLPQTGDGPRPIGGFTYSAGQ